jgi:hypothetical protein
MILSEHVFYSEELLASQPSSKLEDYPLSYVHVYLFSIFASTLHSWRPCFHQQPGEMPCCGDKGPHLLHTVFVHTRKIQYKITEKSNSVHNPTSKVVQVRFTHQSIVLNTFILKVKMS